LLSCASIVDSCTVFEFSNNKIASFPTADAKGAGMIKRFLETCCWFLSRRKGRELAEGIRCDPVIVPYDQVPVGRDHFEHVLNRQTTRTDYQHNTTTQSVGEDGGPEKC
jgi:hypothetical protein